MRLLDRPTIENTQNLQQKLETERGLKLAQRVDDLQKRRTKDEKDYLAWKEKTLLEVQKEIDSAVSRRNLALKEAEIAEKRRFEASAPLDIRKERAKNQEEAKKNAKTFTDLLESESSIIAREGMVEVREQEVDMKARKAVVDQNLASQHLKKAYLDRKNASKILTDAEKQLSAMEKDLSKRHSVLAKAENEVALREKNVRNSIEEIALREETLAKEQKHIESQQKTLQAAWQAYRKLTGK